MSCGSAAHAPSYTLERASRLVSTHSREHHAGRVFDTIDTVVWRDAETNLCVCAGAKRSSGTVCSLGSYWARKAVGSTLRMRRCLSCEAREPPRASLGLPLCHFCVSFPKGSRELGRFRCQIWTVERFQRTKEHVSPWLFDPEQTSWTASSNETPSGTHSQTPLPTGRWSLVQREGRDVCQQRDELRELHAPLLRPERRQRHVHAPANQHTVLSRRVSPERETKVVNSINSDYGHSSNALAKVSQRRLSRTLSIVQSRDRHLRHPRSKRLKNVEFSPSIATLPRAAAPGASPTTPRPPFSQKSGATFAFRSLYLGRFQYYISDLDFRTHVNRLA